MTCPVCEKSYEANPARVKWGRRTTCSRSCSYKLRAQGLKKSVSVLCPVCKTSFTASPKRISDAAHGSVYCSKKCMYAGRTLGLTKRVVTKPYTYTPEGKAALLAASSKPKGQRAFHPLVCTLCKVAFDDPNDGRERTSGLIFCSLKCCNTYRRGPNNPAWRGGHPAYYGQDWPSVRKAARDRDKVCRRCKTPPGCRELDVHHIIPVSSFPNPNDANTLSNVLALCHPCHMHVEWNGLDFTT